MLFVIDGFALGLFVTQSWPRRFRRKTEHQNQDSCSSWKESFDVLEGSEYIVFSGPRRVYREGKMCRSKVRPFLHRKAGRGSQTQARNFGSTVWPYHIKVSGQTLCAVIDKLPEDTSKKEGDGRIGGDATMHPDSAACVVLTSNCTIEQTLWVKHAAGAWEAASGSESTQNGAVLHGC